MGGSPTAITHVADGSALVTTGERSTPGRVRILDPTGTLREDSLAAGDFPIAIAVPQLAAPLLFPDKRSTHTAGDRTANKSGLSSDFFVNETLGGNSPSDGGAISDSGGCLAFYSEANNLIPSGLPSDDNEFRDVYLRSDAGTFELVSIGFDGTAANGPSSPEGFPPSIDNSCRCVSFSSDATNLVPGDTNERTDIFLRELNFSTELLSFGFDGSANGASSHPSVSGDCSRVAFQSAASNLVPGDENLSTDIFVHDRFAQIVDRISTPVEGGEADDSSITPSISGNGQCIAFASRATNLWPEDTNGASDIYVSCDGIIVCRASVNSAFEEANADSSYPDINFDGTIVAFLSDATNLVVGDDNGQPDVFVHDCATGVTQRISVSTAGADGDAAATAATIADDGSVVAFGSSASNLQCGTSILSGVQTYLRNLETEVTTLLSVNANGEPANGSSSELAPGLSPDGESVAFGSVATDLVSMDSNGFSDIFTTSVGLAATPSPSPTGTGTPTPTGTPTSTSVPPQALPGDCNRDDDVSIEELIRSVNIALGAAELELCRAADIDGDGRVAVHELVSGVSTALVGVPTATPVPMECSATDDCRVGIEVCLGNRCVCAGDCNRDGTTTRAELNAVEQIGAGNLPISACASADRNQDGRLTCAEELVAAYNEATSCDQPSEAPVDPCSILGCGDAGCTCELLSPCEDEVCGCTSGLACKCAGATECIGDCSGDGTVQIPELVRGVAIALGSQPLDECDELDGNGDGEVGVGELIQSVISAVSGCP